MFPMSLPTYLINDPVIVKEMLSMKHLRTFHKGPEYDVIAPLIGKGLLSSEEDHWQKQEEFVIWDSLCLCSETQ